MRSQSVSWKLLLSCSVWLSVGAAVANNGRAPNHDAAIALNQPNLSQSNYLPPGSKFDCLPKDVRLDEVVTYARTAKGNVTVEKKLTQMKARCRHGKLVDAKRREIRFFRPSCWGNPPSDYLEIQQRENAELQKLKASYAVIVFGCDRMISKLSNPHSLRLRTVYYRNFTFSNLSPNLSRNALAWSPAAMMNSM